MISKNDLQYYSSLLKKKYRKVENKFLVEGKKSVFEGINSSYNCEMVFVTSKFIKEHEESMIEIADKNNKVEIIKQKDFQKISDTESPQEIAAVFVKPAFHFSTDRLLNEKIIVMLNNISDPGNLGTIIRNCDWFGIKNILLSENIVDFTNPKAIRATMGSIFHVNVYENILRYHLNDLISSGYEILCADVEGENIFTYKSEKKKVLIFSSEAHGPTKEFESISDKKICIPRIGRAESLNVASASAVILAHLTK